jgi:hypothetical protein
MKAYKAILLTFQCLLGLALLFFIRQIAAVEQFTQSQCLQLATELDNIRTQQRQGLRLQHSERIKANELQLTQQLHYHCANPQTEPVAKSAAHLASSHHNRKLPQHLRHQVAVTAKQPPRELTFSTIVSKSRYQGKQLQAWLDYYREPRFCYGVRLTHLMVICTELRQQAQREFEQHWQQQQPNTLSDQ